MRNSTTLSMRSIRVRKNRPRASCPAAYLIPAVQRVMQSDARADSGEHSTCSSRTASVVLKEPPYAPGKELVKPKRGIRKIIDVMKVKFDRLYFKCVFSALKAPFRNEATVQDMNHILTLISFLAINLWPCHIFSFLVCLDYAFLSQFMQDYMPVFVRLIWLQILYCITWFFVTLYGINVVRLVISLFANNPLRNMFWWLDWEEVLYQVMRPRVIQRMKDAANNLWEDYHKRVWSYIRGIQAEVCEKEQAIHEICEARNLPPLVEGMLCDFVNHKGTKELDYRWYLHDNRENSKTLEGLDYKCRETIASYLIPEQAFALNKDQIVDLYCQ